MQNCWETITEANEFFIVEMNSVIISKISGNYAPDLANVLQIWIYPCIFWEVSRNSYKVSSKWRVTMAIFVEKTFWKFKREILKNGYALWHISDDFSAEILRSERCKSRRSRQKLSHEYLLANIGFDKAENDPPKVWRRFYPFLHSPLPFAGTVRPTTAPTPAPSAAPTPAPSAARNLLIHGGCG